MEDGLNNHEIIGLWVNGTRESLVEVKTEFLNWHLIVVTPRSRLFGPFLPGITRLKCLRRMLLEEKAGSLFLQPQQGTLRRHGILIAYRFPEPGSRVCAWVVNDGPGLLQTVLRHMLYHS